jgi:hypothetical protein
VSERRACEVLSQPRSTQRRKRCVPSDEPRLLKRIVELASDYGRDGYRRVTALLRYEGWAVNHKRVDRLWRQEGLKVPQKQPDGSDCGWPTVPAYDCAQSPRITSGATTLSPIAPATTGRFGCSP